ncbi:MAG: DegV family protein [Chloroflexi bacterium]|nr:DegV family protein [Chloroflexota bacterium]
MTISLVTDSTADVPADLVERFGIRVVPAVVVMGGQTYRDGLDMTRDEFYRRLPTIDPLPSTAAPAAGEFEEVYDSLPDGPIISLHLAAAFSGIFNAARIAAQKFGDRVTVVDTGTVSMGIGWQVIAAAESAAGGAPLNAVLALITSVRRRLKMFALLDTLDNLRRGGRISLIRASIGTILQVKPLLDIGEDKLTPVSQERTRRKAQAGLISLVQSFGSLERLAVLYSDNGDLGVELLERLKPQAQTPPLLIQATPALGTHAGTDAVGVALVTV